VIRQNRRIAAARLALHRVRDAVHPISLDELTRITEIWVDTALQLGDKSLRMMERLVRAQLRRPEVESRDGAGPDGAAAENIGALL
jgi:DSF synthase